MFDRIHQWQASGLSQKTFCEANFYLPAIDTQLKHSSDNPCIRILLYRTKDKIDVEYALRGINKPIGVSAFELSKPLLENLRTQPPTVEEMEQGFVDNI